MEPTQHLLNKLFRLTTIRMYEGKRNDVVYALIEQNQVRPFCTPLALQEALNRITPDKTQQTFYNRVKAIVDDFVNEFSEFAWC